MSLKKIFYAFDIVAAIFILAGTAFFLVGGKLGAPILNPDTDGTVPPIIVFQSGGSALLIAECADKNYISSKADYIIKGTVERAKIDWNENKSSIFTYTTVAIKNFVKGTPFAENNELTIITPGGCVGIKCQAVEDRPIFHKGKKVKISLRETNGKFSMVCGQMGVEEI